MMALPVAVGEPVAGVDVVQPANRRRAATAQWRCERRTDDREVRTATTGSTRSRLVPHPRLPASFPRRRAGLPRRTEAAGLLALLLLQSNRLVSTDKLIEQLWPEKPPGKPHTAVQGYISDLRKVLEASGGQVPIW